MKTGETHQKALELIAMPIIHEMANAIITTWDLCGNAQEATKQIATDHGIRWQPEIHDAAGLIAHREWSRCRKAAREAASIS